MTLKELERFAKTVGKPLSKEELKQISEIRQNIIKSENIGGTYA